MIAGLQEIYPVGAYSIDQPVFLGEAARPASRKHVFQWLGLTNASEQVAQNTLDKVEGPECGFAVGRDPITNVIAELGMEYGVSHLVMRRR